MSHSRAPRAPRSTSRSTSRPAPRSAPRRIELTFLPGLADVLADEVRAALRPARDPYPTPGRDDALLLDHRGPLRAVLRLRTAVAAFEVLAFPVARPGALARDAHLARLADAVARARRLDAAHPARSFRFEAAGSTSPAFRHLADALTRATGLPHRPGDGDLVLRVRRRTDGTDSTGWEALVRLTTRPLATRDWRVADYPGAANATVAAAMALLTRPRPADRVANLMSGSGTLLIERLRTAPAARAVAVDHSPAAHTACTANLRAAGLAATARQEHADLADDAWLRHGPFDVLLADPPWGTLCGSHATAEAAHTLLLTRAHAAAAPGARCAVLTHELRVMDRCLERAAPLWRPRARLQVFHKGHHPRIYLLEKAG